MKKIIVFCLILISNITLSQTKIETKDWIIEKYNEYKRNTTVIPKNSFDLYFKDDELIHIYINREFRIKLKDIKKIQIKKEKFDENDKEGWTAIFIFFEKDKLKYEGNLSKDTMFKIAVNTEFLEDGYKERMEKALLHLIGLYGGKATIKNEPF